MYLPSKKIFSFMKLSRRLVLSHLIKDIERGKQREKSRVSDGGRKRNMRETEYMKERERTHASVVLKADELFNIISPDSLFYQNYSQSASIILNLW